MRRRLILLALLLTANASCEREEPDNRAQPAVDESNVQATVSGLQPGAQAPPPSPEYELYTENPYQTGEGKRLFAWFNCTGSHASGGGGMGPPLMDDRWIYGSEPQNIYATIVEGRSNGMPPFRGKVPDSQVWQLVTYVRALGGLARKDAAPGATTAGETRHTITPGLWAGLALAPLAWFVSQQVSYSLVYRSTEMRPGSALTRPSAWPRSAWLGPERASGTRAAR
jgi:cytochrome c oxidase cbb3-type subunit 3